MIQVKLILEFLKKILQQSDNGHYEDDNSESDDSNFMSEMLFRQKKQKNRNQFKNGRVNGL